MDKVQKEFGFKLDQKEYTSLLKVERGTPGEPGLKPNEILACTRKALLKYKLIEKEYCCECLMLTELGVKYLALVKKILDK